MKQHGNERGTSVVEFALILPILILLIFGIVEFGRAYQVQTTLSAAAREGARSVALGQPGQARGAVKNFDATIGIKDSEITISLDPTPATSPDRCPSPGTNTTNVKVTVTHEHDFLTGFFGANVTLTGKGTMRCEG